MLDRPRYTRVVQVVTYPTSHLAPIISRSIVSISDKVLTSLEAELALEQPVEDPVVLARIGPVDCGCQSSMRGHECDRLTLVY